MTTAGGVVSRSAWQGLLRPTAKSQARSGLLVRKPRWISSEQQARCDQLSPPRPETVNPVDRWLLERFGKPIKSIDLNSSLECKEPVRQVASKIECLCSWNQASGSRHAIYVPGDASRPKSRTHESLDLPAPRDLFGYCNPGRGPRSKSWDDALAALYVMEPELKLNDVDVIIHEDMLLHFLVAALDGTYTVFRNSAPGFVFNMSLVDNTLVIRSWTRKSSAEVVKVANPFRPDWEYYKAATDSVPEVEDSSVHFRLLRYKFGPLSCLVYTRANGTIQKRPTSTGPSDRPPAREVHGIDVITAGQGIQTSMAFRGAVRHRVQDNEYQRLRRTAPRLWLSGQTKLGVADAVPARQGGSPGRLTVVEMGELVSRFEHQNQRSLRRVAGLLAALRDAVREHGAQCTGVFFSPPRTGDSTHVPPNHPVYVHSAGPDEIPELLDWQKEHFWSQRKAPSDDGRPQTGDINEHSRPQKKTNGEHTQPQKSVIRKWAKWLGF